MPLVWLLSIIFTAWLCSILIFLMKESLVWDQTVIQWDTGHNQCMQEQMSGLNRNEIVLNLLDIKVHLNYQSAMYFVF